ncbi:MAG: hypothetical protein ACHQAY_17120 [Hyphomicrobiales bacterium]
MMMADQARRRLCFAALVVPLALIAPPSAMAQTIVAAPLQPIRLDELCVTNGTVTSLPDGRMQIDTPSSRAVVRVPTGQSAEIRFRYLGPSLGSKPLASGEMRRQIGLKLRAQDTCNLVYATWHIEPDAKFGVSIKRNIGKRTHEECHADGYVTIKPRAGVTLPQLRPGETHSLRADLKGSALTLTADGKTVWDGDLGPRIMEFDGPVGLRTDNARFEFAYFASRAEASPNYVPQCRTGPGN